MDNELLKILSEELRETKQLVKETRRVADAAWEDVKETRRIALSSERKADAAWEQVVMTRNEIQVSLANLRLPWWKKLFGRTG